MHRARQKRPAVSAAIRGGARGVAREVEGALR